MHSTAVSSCQERFQRLENLFLRAKSKQDGGHVKAGNSFERSGRFCLGLPDGAGFLEDASGAWRGDTCRKNTSDMKFCDCLQLD